MAVEDQNNEVKRHKGFDDIYEEKMSNTEDISDVLSNSSRYVQPRNDHSMSRNEWQMQQQLQPEDTDLTDAIVFLNKIRDEYKEQSEIYDNFLETMRDFKLEKIDADEVCRAIRVLFKDKIYLIKLFDEYLPHHLRYAEYAAFDEKRGGQFRPPYKASAQNLAMSIGRIQSIGPNFVTRPIKPLVTYSEVYQENATRAKPDPSEDDSPRKKMARDFIHVVKKRYNAKPHIYKQFVEILHNSSNNFEKLYTQVNALLWETPDLVERFERNFKACVSTNDVFYTTEIDPLKKIKTVLAQKGVLEPFLKYINFYNQNYISANELISIVEPILENEENLTALKNFIRMGEPSVDHETRFKHLKKIGSYRILETKIPLRAYGQILNDYCVCVPTYESEEDVFVFRDKNYSEELVSRIMDERSDSDLLLDRLRFLIIRLEDVYELVDGGEIEMDDIQMSSSLVKDTLRTVYDNKCNEILEAILITPKKAIPIVLRRLMKVYVDNSLYLREYKRFWRGVVDSHYYKSYDTKGVCHRSLEKNTLSLKNIYSESTYKFTIDIEDTGILSIIQELFTIYISSHKDHKKATTVQAEVLDQHMKNLISENVSMVIDFNIYALYYYILSLYDRFKQVKSLKLEPMTSNLMAVSINLQTEFNVVDRFLEVVDAGRKLVSKELDVEMFEENVRRLTDNLGFKLYNLKKIMSKIEKLINRVIDKEEVPEEVGTYNFVKKNNTVKMEMINQQA